MSNGIDQSVPQRWVNRTVDQMAKMKFTFPAEFTAEQRNSLILLATVRFLMMNAKTKGYTLQDVHNAIDVEGAIVEAAAAQAGKSDIVKG